MDVWRNRNRISLCRSAVFAKSTNKNTNKKKSDPLVSAAQHLLISLALVAITRDPYITIILISIGGFGHQIISCMLSALVVESFDKGQMATVNGMRGSAAWIASFLFSLLIGVTADKIGFNPLFIAMGFFDLIGAVFLVAFIAERRAKRA